MKCKINRNAAKVLKKMLEDTESKGRMVRVIVTETHGNHAHYDITLDTPTEHDSIVQTDKDIEVLVDSRNEFLHNIWIQYYFVPREGFVITNPTKEKPNH